jgi:hypothetical protein
MSRSTTTVITLRETLAQRRTLRHERQRLERELASYDTPAARLELEAMLERHSPEETAEIRRILERQSASRLVSRH